ncbi:hypothetical protein QCD71_09570 [Sphingomonas sp. PsM26]|nr:hypothetical protein [Sphingomonas sp. PsM26]
MIGVLLGIAVVKMLVVHLVLVAAFGWTVAILLGVVDVAAVLDLTLLLRSFKRLPVVLTADVLMMRTGFLKSLTVPVAQIAGTGRTWDAATLKQRGVVNFALIGWPNVWLDLDPPVQHRRGTPVSAIAHKLDDPVAFHAAIAALSAAHGH